MSNTYGDLSLVDRRLIRELDRNCRETYTALSKRLNIPAETIRYRTKLLVESGIISSFYAVVDAGKLGCSVHKVLFKLHNVDEKKVTEIVEYLVGNAVVNWVARFDGIFDLSFTMWASSIAEVSAFVDELKSRFHRYLSRIALAVNIQAEFLARDPVQKGKRRPSPQALYTTPSARYRADELDFAILKILAGNPRMSATAIAKDVGVTSETVGMRIKNLEREKVITGYRIVVDSTKIAEMNLYVLVYLNAVSQDEIQRLMDYCRSLPQVNYIIKALGAWDYELNVETKDILEYRTLMMELTREFSGIIRDYTSLPVSNIYKLMIMPPGAVRTE